MKVYLSYFIVLILTECLVRADNRIKTVYDLGVLTTSQFSAQPVKRTNVVYTQGLILTDNGTTLLESGGLYSQSVLVKMDFPSLKVVKKVQLDSKYFAEGIARCGDFIYQLTWQERAILKFSYPGLILVDTLKMDVRIGEGWGLASNNNPNELIASDGSKNIYTLDCNNNLTVKSSISVKLNGNGVERINALSFANGYIYANKYFDKNIYKIDPETGNVVKTYDMTTLVNFELDRGTLTSFRLDSGDVLNGIAFDSATNTFILTGKKWGYYYLTKLN